MKEFITAAEAATTEEPEEGVPFMVVEMRGEERVEVECRYYQPTEAQLALLMADLGRHTSLTQQIAGSINFFVGVLDETSHQYLVSRLLDRDDPFGLDQVQDIIAWMVEEWTGRPTKLPSGSTPSRQNGGRSSTRRTSRSTSSRSLPIGS